MLYLFRSKGLGKAPERCEHWPDSAEIKAVMTLLEVRGSRHRDTLHAITNLTNGLVNHGHVEPLFLCARMRELAIGALSDLIEHRRRVLGSTHPATVAAVHSRRILISALIMFRGRRLIEVGEGTALEAVSDKYGVGGAELQKLFAEPIEEVWASEWLYSSSGA